MLDIVTAKSPNQNIAINILIMAEHYHAVCLGPSSIVMRFTFLKQSCCPSEPAVWCLCLHLPWSWQFHLEIPPVVVAAENKNNGNFSSAKIENAIRLDDTTTVAPPAHCAHEWPWTTPVAAATKSAQSSSSCTRKGQRRTKNKQKPHVESNQSPNEWMHMDATSEASKCLDVSQESWHQASVEPDLQSSNPLQGWPTALEPQASWRPRVHNSFLTDKGGKML